MDLHVSRTPTVARQRHVIRLVALVSVVLNSHCRPFRALIDDESKHRTNDREMLTSVDKPDLERSPQPESNLIPASSNTFCTRCASAVWVWINRLR